MPYFKISHKTFSYDIAIFECQSQVSIVNDGSTIQVLDNKKVAFTCISISL